MFIAMQLQAQSITVDAFAKCKVALINYDEIQRYANDNPENSGYAWWYLWQDKKAEAASTPYTFKNLKPGLYTMVIYNPNADSSDEGDGLALQNVPINSKSSIKLFFQKGDFKEWNCLSCPWMYCKKGNKFLKQSEILQDVVGKENQTTTTHELPKWSLKNGKVTIRLQEEKDEITYIDHLTLSANGESFNSDIAELQGLDNNYLIMKKGDVLEITFDLPKHIKKTDKLILKATGYYIPDEKMLQAAYEKYLVNILED